ncbi:MAG: hypothetical protein D6761_02080, partial [Candidatus Dadabacteria bacterium]
MIRILLATLLLNLLTACNAEDVNEADGVPETIPVVYDVADTPWTTLQGVWKPKTPTADVLKAIADDPSLITDITRYDELGLGIEFGDGEPWQEYTDLAPGYAAWATTNTSADTKSLLYFWQAADEQIIDEESPIRYAGVWNLVVGSSYRPNGHLTTQTFDAHVRTANRIAAASSRGFDFGIVTGDLTDGGQQNELDWFITLMSGGVVDPDSGVNDDPIPGPGNDFNDPFTAEGLNAPWFAVVGNHETLYIGSGIVNDTIAQAAISDTVFTDALCEGLGVCIDPTDGLSPGFRRGDTPDAAVVTSGRTPADPKRRILTLPEVLTALQQAPGEPEGHGMTAEDAANGIGDFSFYPIEGAPIRVIALNTIYRNEMGLDDLTEYSLGFMTTDQLTWLKDELDAAAAAGELVIIASHHRSSDFNSNSPVSGKQLATTLASYGNVVLHITGHGHYSAMQICTADGSAPCADANGVNAGSGYWELMMPSTADFPLQSRIIELAYEGSRYLTIYVTNIDDNAPPGSLAHEARKLAAGRRFFYDDLYNESYTHRAAVPILQVH